MSATAMESVGIGIATSHAQEGQPIPIVDNKPPVPSPENPAAQSDSSKQPDSETAAPTTMNQNTIFWDAYNKAGDGEDKEFVMTSGSDLDALLIFAGLFSAINTSFIIESYKNLKPDPAEETNKLLRSVFSATINPSGATLDETPFTASPRDVRINCFFFTSLCCSLCAAFGAVLAKQWLTQYDRDGGGSLKSPAIRGRERHRKSEGRWKWHLEDVIVTLPTLLQFSLFFFFIGLIDLLWPLNDAVTSIILSFTLATFLFYIITIAIAIADKSAPFQTRLSIVLQPPARRVLTLVERLVARRRKEAAAVVEPRNVDIPCFTYLFERMVELEHVGVFADAVVSLWDGLNRVEIRTRFVDTYLKPTVDQVWSLPRLYGPHRLPLLKILALLVKDWGKVTTIHTPTYPSLSTAQFSSAIPIALRKAFVADPADTESLQHIVTILFTLRDLGHSPSSSEHRNTDEMELWLHDDVTKNLEHKDSLIQRNTLKLLAFIATSSTPDAQTLLWHAVHKASSRNQELRRLTQMDLLKDLLTGLPKRDADAELRVLRTLHLFGFLALEQPPENLGKLAGTLETLPLGSQTVETEVLKFLSRVVEVLVVTHLKPKLDRWWKLSGLDGPEKRLILGIVHVIVVERKYLESDLMTLAPSYQLLHPLLSSLRTELWGYFLASLKDSEGSKDLEDSKDSEDSRDRRMISAICKNLPMLESLGDDEITAASRQKVGSEMWKLLQSNPRNNTKVEDTVDMLCSNPDLWITFTRLPRPSQLGVTPSLVSLCYTMWDGDTADLEDFWKAIIRVQIFPAMFPGQPNPKRFPEYLHLWLQRYYLQEGANKVRQLAICWTYLLSLEQILSTTQAPWHVEVFKVNRHQSHLMDIYFQSNFDEHNTCSLVALYLFLRLWDLDTSDLMEEHGRRIVLGGRFPKLDLTRMTKDYRMYAQSSRAGHLSDEEWSEEVSYRAETDMGQMTMWLRSYLKAAVRGRLFEPESGNWDAALDNYGNWCYLLDMELGRNEFRNYADELRALILDSRKVEGAEEKEGEDPIGRSTLSEDWDRRPRRLTHSSDGFGRPDWDHRGGRSTSSFDDLDLEDDS